MWRYVYAVRITRISGPSVPFDIDIPQAANEARDKKAQSYDQKMKARADARELQRKQQAEAAAKKLADEAQEAQSLMDDWKAHISVDSQGSVEDDVGKESQGLLQDFLDYIKRNKVVMLEDLAAEFGLRTQDCVKRIHSLEAAGTLTGLIDDRGKYIYIAPEEIENVAAFIDKRGRISIQVCAPTHSACGPVVLFFVRWLRRACH